MHLIVVKFCELPFCVLLVSKKIMEKEKKKKRCEEMSKKRERKAQQDHIEEEPLWALVFA